MRVLAWAYLFVLASCATAYPHRGIRPLRPLELATAPYTGEVAEVLSGSLLYEGGCLLFRDDRSKELLLPVWPFGSIFNGTAVIFHEPGKADQPILVTQELVVEGQREQWPSLAAATYAPFQQQCRAQPFLVSRTHPAD